MSLYKFLENNFDDEGNVSGKLDDAWARGSWGEQDDTTKAGQPDCLPEAYCYCYDRHNYCLMSL